MRRFIAGFVLGVIGGVLGLGAVILFEFSEEEINGGVDDQDYNSWTGV